MTILEERHSAYHSVESLDQGDHVTQYFQEFYLL